MAGVKGRSGVYIRTDWHKSRIRGSFTKGSIPWNKGKTKETDERIAKLAKNVQSYYETHSHSSKGKPGRKWTDSQRKQMAEITTEVYREHPELGQRQSELMKTLWQDLDWRQHLTEKRKAIVQSESYGAKMSQSIMELWENEQYREKHLGANHHFWNGGPKIYGAEWGRNLRREMRKRDGYYCQICWMHEDELNGNAKVHSVHHIDYNPKNCDPNNLITLCRKCHLATNRHRLGWMMYFGKSVQLM